VAFGTFQSMCTAVNSAGGCRIWSSPEHHGQQQGTSTSTLRKPIGSEPPPLTITVLETHVDWSTWVSRDPTDLRMMGQAKTTRVLVLQRPVEQVWSMQNFLLVARARVAGGVNAVPGRNNRGVTGALDQPEGSLWRSTSTLAGCPAGGYRSKDNSQALGALRQYSARVVRMHTYVCTYVSTGPVGL
jgi:hypothetical protein